MSVIDDFLLRYQREYDYYFNAAREVHQACENGLSQAAVRGIVTFRAKRPDRLRAKLLLRQEKKAMQYSSVESIYEDIRDLAGVRIALYFPNHRDEVEKFIRGTFNVTHAKEHPDTGAQRPNTRFSGYSAMHFFVHLKPDQAGQITSYAGAQVEIQVASVLMHAWSEVEHDLVYKPLSGTVSPQELQIIDGLNGLVQVGEVSLALLSEAVRNRTSQLGRRFGNHWELGAFLYGTVTPARAEGLATQQSIGPVERLFTFLQRIDQNTVDAIQAHTRATGKDDERTVVQRIIDGVLAEKPGLWRIYFELPPPTDSTGDHTSVHPLQEFILAWAALGQAVAATVQSSESISQPTAAALNKLRLTPEDRDDLDKLMLFRRTLFETAHFDALTLASLVQRVKEITMRIVPPRSIQATSAA